MVIAIKAKTNTKPTDYIKDSNNIPEIKVHEEDSGLEASFKNKVFNNECKSNRSLNPKGRHLGKSRFEPILLVI